MLVVNNLLELPKYGFDVVNNNIYKKTLWQNEDAIVALLVNEVHHVNGYSKDNRLQIVTTIERECDGNYFFLDKAIPLDTVYQMIKDGIVDVI